MRGRIFWRREPVSRFKPFPSEDLAKSSGLLDRQRDTFKATARLSPFARIQSIQQRRVCGRLGVWAAERISNALEIFDLSESRWCHLFGMGKGSSTPENAGNVSIEFLPPRLLDG